MFDLRNAFVKVDFWPFKELLEEMDNFIRDKKGKYQAASGKHDDLVMATAIAYGVIGWNDIKEEKKEETHKSPRMAFTFGEISFEEMIRQIQKEKEEALLG